MSYQTVKVQRRTPLNCYVTCKNSMREYKYISKAIGKYQLIVVNRIILTQRYIINLIDDKKFSVVIFL